MKTHLCSGEAAALDAASGDMGQCADCQRHFRSGDLFIYPHGNICEDCDQERVDGGMTQEVLGQSPRDLRAPRLVITAISRPNPALFGSREERDAFADLMLAKEREMNEAMADLPEPKPTQLQLNRWAGEQDEITTEGRRHGK
jgi:hypothetical protein